MTRHLALLAALWATLLETAMAGAPRPTDRTLTIQVHNYSRMPTAKLNIALGEVVRLFNRIGIAVQYTDKTSERPVPQFHVLVTDRELAELRDLSRPILGVTPQSSHQSGRVAYVFREPIDALASAYAVDGALVAAHTIAHEIGHMLLPTTGHSSEGLMYPVWGVRQVRAAAGGRLTFSSDETNLMRAALPPEDSVPLLVKR